jgi:hypothetical protein
MFYYCNEQEKSINTSTFSPPFSTRSFGPMTTGTEKLLQAVLDKTVDGKKIFGACFAIKNDTFK